MHIIFAVISPEDPKWWMTHTPNYYFPKSDISELGTSSIVVFASLIGNSRLLGNN